MDIYGFDSRHAAEPELGCRVNEALKVDRVRAMYGMLYVLAPARAGAMHKLTFFTHVIDNKLYGGWYRLRSTTEVEVQAVGLLDVVSWEGRSPEAAAQCRLEEFVAQRRRYGEPVAALDEIFAELQEAEIGAIAPDSPVLAQPPQSQLRSRAVLT